MEEEPSKRAYELFALTYTPIWIFAFGCIVAFGLYERFDEWSYLYVCVGLALPFLLQPIIMPSAGFGSPMPNDLCWNDTRSRQTCGWLCIRSLEIIGIHTVSTLLAPAINTTIHECLTRPISKT